MRLLNCDNNGLIEVLSGDGSGLYIDEKPLKKVNKNAVGQPIIHLPQVRRNGGYVHVKVGREEHPMTDQHHIEWIAVEYGNAIQRVYLGPDDPPEASFYVHESEDLVAYAYCNMHGLWRS